MPYQPPPHPADSQHNGQVIKCELFDRAVDLAVKRYPLMLLSQPAGQGQALLAAAGIGVL